MHNKILIDDIKYTYDDPKEYLVDIDSQFYQTDFEIKSKKINLATRGLQISEELFPRIFKSIKKVNEKLNTTNEINYYIIPDSSHNAYCLPITKKESAVVINSGLVELLDDKELEYVIGHEVGHHVFSHLNYPRNFHEHNENVGLKKLSQAAEISVDRVGLYCNNNLDACINSMMKMASGLKPPYINFNHKVFINQLKSIIDLKGDKNQIYQSHPMIFVRAKALLIFSESKAYNESIGNKNFKHTKKEMDTYVNKIISQSEGYAFDEKQTEEYNDLKMWTEVKIMISNKNWQEGEKILLENSIGKEKMKKIDSLIVLKKKSGLDPIKEINKKWNNIVTTRSSLLTKTKKEELIDELESLCKDLINSCGHKHEKLLEELSKISNNLGLDRTIHIKI